MLYSSSRENVHWVQIWRAQRPFPKYTMSSLSSGAIPRVISVWQCKKSMLMIRYEWAHSRIVR
ncbi:hypothetical protein AVEN_170661-1, partial [Araneus ventricosus]